MRLAIAGVMRVTVCVLAAVVAGCVPQVGDGSDGTGSEITRVPTPDQPRTQAIGNCWLYAASGWAETLVRLGTPGSTVDFSEDYWSYWYWYGQLAFGLAAPKQDGKAEIVTGGSFSISQQLILSYGTMSEWLFDRTRRANDGRARSVVALERVNKALASGELRWQGNDPAVVRAVLDDAWALDARTIGLFDSVFGRASHRTFFDDDAAVHAATVSGIMPPDHTAVAYPDGSGQPPSVHTLRDAAFTFWEVPYPLDPTQRRAVQQMVQRALHAGIAVPNAWVVDKPIPTSTYDKPGQYYGLHETLIVDYDIDTPHFGHLEAGVEETRPAALDDALTADAKLRFFRIKNWWGVANYVAKHGDQLDLHMSYLDALTTIPAEDFGKIADNFAFDPTASNDPVDLGNPVDLSNTKGEVAPHLLSVALPPAF